METSSMLCYLFSHPYLHLYFHTLSISQVREAARVLEALRICASSKGKGASKRSSKGGLPLVLGPIGDEPDFDFKVWRVWRGGGLLDLA